MQKILKVPVRRMPREAINEPLYRVQARKKFDANIRIKIPVHCSGLLFDDLFLIVEKIEDQYNSYKKGSYFEQINRNSGTFVEVDDVAIALLRKSMEIAAFFEGSYDISIMPLLRQWGFYDAEKSRTIPKEEDLQEALKKVDFRNIEIRNNSVRIPKEQELLTASFIKAYAVDQVMKKLKQEGVTDAVVNAGNSTIAGLNDQSHLSWDINISDPDLREHLLFTLKLSNTSFSTSAQKEGSIKIGERTYGHILNPKTGFPATNKQVGVVSENCVEGDMLSTALMTADSKKWTEIMPEINKKWNVSGYMIDQSRTIFFSENFKEEIHLI